MVVTILGVFIFYWDKNFQLALVTSACVSYFAWGAIHHFLHKDLSLSVLIEYAVIAGLGFVVCVSVIFR